MAKDINLLKEEAIHANHEEYFDASRQLFDTIPVFPFLDETTIEQQIQFSIDTDVLRQEIEDIATKAREEGAVIMEQGYIISLISWHKYPCLIDLLTIIREWAFRNDGGGVGDFDTDSFDTLEQMKQLIIVNPHFTDPIEAIIGGYRYMIHDYDSYSTGPMGAHFKFEESWRKEQWIELGRSFINPYYKERDRKQSFDYVLYGLGYIYAKHKECKGYFGKVTLYQIYELTKADAFFLGCAKTFLKENKAVQVFEEERIAEAELTQEHLSILNRDVFKGLFFILRKEFKINIVPIMAVYNRMVDLNKMHYFGAFRHKEFGNTTEVGIAIAFEDIYDVIKEKFAKDFQ